MQKNERGPFLTSCGTYRLSHSTQQKSTIYSPNYRTPQSILVVSLHDLGVAIDFLNMLSKIQVIKGTINGTFVQLNMAVLQRTLQREKTIH